MPEACTALITGAARGIGRQVALTLAERCYRIAANDLEAPEYTVEELRATGAEALPVPGDVSDEAEPFGADDVSAAAPLLDHPALPTTFTEMERASGSPRE